MKLGFILRCHLYEHLEDQVENILWQDRQYTCNATLRCIQVSIVPVESNAYYIFWVCVCVCVCSLRYPACNVHVLYCHLWPAWLSSIFPHYLINDMIFDKKWLNMKCMFWSFSTTFVWNFSQSEKNWARYYHKCA